MLEILVSDQVRIFDDLDNALEYLVQVVKEWYLSDEELPLEIMLKKGDNKSPPTLSININDSVKTKAVFG